MPTLRSSEYALTVATDWFVVAVSAFLAGFWLVVPIGDPSRLRWAMALQCAMTLTQIIRIRVLRRRLFLEQITPRVQGHD